MKWKDIIITREWIYQFPHKLLNKLKLRIVRNQEIKKKHLKYYELRAKIQDAIFDICATKFQKSAVKKYLEKTYFT